MSVNKTYSAKPDEVVQQWHLVDASAYNLGRLASVVASILRGKHKPIYTPHIDTGDYVIIINSAKVRVTGNKLSKKIYHHHTGYIGNMKHESLGHRLNRRPELVIRQAVRGMLPRGSLGRQMITKLKVYDDDNHPHAAQQPRPLQLKT